MIDKKDNNQLFFVFRETLFFIKTLLLEFEKVFDNEKIVKKISRVRIVYMEVIIINLAKIFSKSKNDKFSIIQLRNISPKREKEKIEKIEKSHKNIIGKILSNRMKIVAHTDLNYHELCFSDNEIRRMEENIKNSMRIEGKESDSVSLKMNRATSKDKERYTPRDLKGDLVEINSLIDQLDNILLEVVMFYYNKNMKIDIENIAEEKGRKIANAIMLKNDEYPNLFGKNEISKKGIYTDIVKGYKEGSEEIKIVKEIYAMALHEATTFFLKNSDLKLNSEIKETLELHLSARVKQPSKLKKLTPEELLGNVIKLYCIDFLLENNIII